MARLTSKRWRRAGQRDWLRAAAEATRALRGVRPTIAAPFPQALQNAVRKLAIEAPPEIGATRVRQLEERIRALERLLGRKTLEVEILKEALAAARAKKPLLRWPSHDPDGSR